MTENRFGFGAGVRWSPQDPGALMSRPAGRAPVAGDSLRAPAEVVGGGDVGEHVEPELVTAVEGSLHEALALDDDGRLAVRLPFLHEPWQAVVAHWPAFGL